MRSSSSSSSSSSLSPFVFSFPPSAPCTNLEDAILFNNSDDGDSSLLIPIAFDEKEEERLEKMLKAPINFQNKMEKHGIRDHKEIFDRVLKSESPEQLDQLDFIFKEMSLCQVSDNPHYTDSILFLEFKIADFLHLKANPEHQPVFYPFNVGALKEAIANKIAEGRLNSKIFASAPRGEYGTDKITVNEVIESCRRLTSEVFDLFFMKIGIVGNLCGKKPSVFSLPSGDRDTHLISINDMGTLLGDITVFIPEITCQKGTHNFFTKITESARNFFKDYYQKRDDAGKTVRQIICDFSKPPLFHQVNKEDKKDGRLYIDQKDFEFFNLWSGLPFFRPRLFNSELTSITDFQSITSNFKMPIFLFVYHLFVVICKRRMEVYKYVLRWLVLKRIMPSKKMGTLLLLVGDQGIGKSMFMQIIANLFGNSSIYMQRTGDIFTSRFASSAWIGKCIVLADEVSTNSKDESTVSNNLKSMITGNTITAEKKFNDRIEISNSLGFILSTNDKDTPLPFDLFIRRIFPLDVSTEKLGDKEYFELLVKVFSIDRNLEGNFRRIEQQESLAYEAIDAFLHVCASDNSLMKGFKPENMPETEELISYRMQNMDLYERWWDLCLRKRCICGLSKPGIKDLGEFYRENGNYRSLLQPQVEREDNEWPAGHAKITNLEVAFANYAESNSSPKQKCKYAPEKLKAFLKKFAFEEGQSLVLISHEKALNKFNNHKETKFNSIYSSSVSDKKRKAQDTNGGEALKAFQKKQQKKRKY